MALKRELSWKQHKSIGFSEFVDWIYYRRNRGVQLSIRSSSSGGRSTLLVDDAMNITEVSGSVKPIFADIYCTNDINKKAHEVIWPRHPDTELLFSANSSSKGICKALGYEAGIYGSRRVDKSEKKNTLRVDKKGDTLRQVFKNPVERVTCIGI